MRASGVRLGGAEPLDGIQGLQRLARSVPRRQRVPGGAEAGLPDVGDGQVGVRSEREPGRAFERPLRLGRVRRGQALGLRAETVHLRQACLEPAGLLKAQAPVFGGLGGMGSGEQVGQHGVAARDVLAVVFGLRRPQRLFDCVPDLEQGAFDRPFLAQREPGVGDVEAEHRRAVVVAE